MTAAAVRHVAFRRLVAIFVLLVAPLALSACNLFVRDETYRYRLTVEVETPSGLRTGSSVIEVEVSQTSDSKLILPDARGLDFAVKGEAVIVDIGPGRVLFALLDRASGIAEAALQPPRYRYDVEYGYLMRIDDMKQMQSVTEAPHDAYPMLVSFGNLDDPTSVKRVDPDNLAATFGEGVSLKRITVQITDDPVTTGIEKRLGWLGTHPEPSLDPTHGPRDYSLPATLHHGAFRTGVTQ